VKLQLACFALACAASLSAAAAEKPRIFITESQALQLSGNATAGETNGSLALTGGTSPQMWKL